MALGKPIKKPPRSDERDGELFCGTDILIPENKLFMSGQINSMFYDIPRNQSSKITLSGYQQMIVACKDITTLHWESSYNVLRPYGYITDGIVTAIGDLRYSTTVTIDKSYDYITIIDIMQNYPGYFWFD